MTREGHSLRCLDCDQPGAYIRLPHARLCTRCKNRRHYHPRACPGCGTVRPLAYRSQTDQEICAACAGVETSIFACNRCRREDNPYGTLCARCTLHDRLTVLLTTPATGAIHPQLQPVFDDLLAANRPQSVITYLTKPPTTGTQLLRAMACGQMPLNIHPKLVRHAARYGLAAELPTAVMADLIGIADQTATRWAALAGRTFNAYIQARDSH